jgi:putative membrane protein
MKLSKNQIGTYLLVIFYAVGVVGMSLELTRELFLLLTPFQLLLTLSILTWVNQDFSRKYWLSFIIVFMIGYWVEVVGVKTGLLFGSYQYGPPLGWKVFEVPLMIGVNWFILSLATKGIASYFTENGWIQVLIASMLMVGFDIILEPVAIALDFWTWNHVGIPVQNYIMWFVTSAVIQLVLWKTIKKVNTNICFAVYFIQVIFFTILNFIL